MGVFKMKEKEKDIFFPVVLDLTGTIRNRILKIHQQTRIQKQKLAAEIMTAGLDVIENRIAAANQA